MNSARDHAGTATGPFVTLLLAASCVLFGWVWLGRDPFTDEGSVCHLATRLLDGKTMYTEAWNEKSPLHFVAAALWFGAFGSSLENLRALAAFDLFLVLLVMVRIAGSAAAFAVTATLMLAPWYQAQHGIHEATLAPLALATLWAAQGGTTAGLLLAGFVGATGVWVKQNFITIFAAFACDGRRRLATMGAAALATALVWMAVFYAHAGAGLWRMPPFGEREAALPFILWGWSEDKTILLAHMLAVTGLVWVSRRGTDGDPFTRHLAAAAFWLALPGLLRPSAFRVWPSAVLAIAASARMLAAMPHATRSRASAAAFAVVVAMGVTRWAIRDGDHALLGRISARVAELTPAGEHIWVGPHEGLIYCLSRRTSATSVDFALPWSPSPSTRAALLAELQSDPPKVLVDASERYHLWQGRLSESLPGIDALLVERYRKVASIEGFDLYSRMDGDAAPLPLLPGSSYKSRRPNPVAARGGAAGDARE